MTTNRYARVRELYEQGILGDILLRAAAEKDDELSELEKELAGETPAAPKKPAVAPQKPAPKRPETVSDLEKELLSALPQATEPAVPEPAEAPKSGEEEKPFVMPGTKLPPETPQMGFAFEPKKYSPHENKAKECPVCHYKNRPIRLMECKKCKNLYNRMKRIVDYYELKPEQAIQSISAQTSYGYRTLKTIYDNLGVTPIIVKDITDVSPGLGKQVEDMLWYRFNVQKDPKTGEPELDEDGIPKPLAKPAYYSSKQLALGLRLTPELFTQKIDEYNAGKREKEWVKPAYSADIISDRPGMRYKATYLSIWNWPRIKPVFAEWIKELEERIIPEEKIERTRGSIKRIEEALESAQSQRETVEEELKILAKESPNRKYLQLLNAFRRANAVQEEALSKKYKVTRSMLEKKYGKELDHFTKTVQLKQTLLGKIAKKQDELRKRLEQRKEWLFKLYEKKGYKFQIQKEVAEKEKDEELKELESELGSEMPGAEQEDGEVSELERELLSRLDVLHRLLRFSAGPEPRQLGLFGDEPKEDPEEKLRRLLETESGSVRMFPGPQPPPPLEPEPEPEPEPERPIVERPEPMPAKPRKVWTDPFGTAKGKYKVSFIAVDPVTKEKKTLRGAFEYTPGARSKSVEEALKKRITDKFQALLVEKHGIGPGTFVRIMVTDPELRTKGYSFKIGKDGEMLWHGTAAEDRRRKMELLEFQPHEKSLWSVGLISLDDLVDVGGKLVEREILEKGFVAPPAEQTGGAVKLRGPAKAPREYVKRVPKLKRIDELRKKKELGAIKEDELSELAELETAEKDMARIEELKAKKDLAPEEKAELASLEDLYEDVKFDPLSKMKPMAEPSEKEPTTFTRECPYPGCGAKVPEDAKTCWKCKSPIAKNELRKVIVRKIAKKELIEKPVRDPQTGTITIVPEEKTTVFPIHSLVTITTDDSGKPVSARCEKLNMTYKDTGGTKRVPAFPKTMKTIQKALEAIEKNPKYTPEQKASAKAKVDELYEKKVSEQPEGGSPWKTIKAKRPLAGLPRDACESCPGEVMAPFEGACGEINAALKSLDPEEKLPYGYTVMDYEKVRHIKDEPEKARHPWVTEHIPEADDGKYASRFDAIMKLYLAD